MSRALDQETIASLKSADPQKAYRDISAIFTAGALPCRLEIEILGHLPEDEAGGNGTVVLRDGPAVAIAKKGLVLAFFVARKVLKEALQRMAKGEGEKMLEEQTAAALAAATSVLLLLDPEHLTAANTRKRLLQARLAQQAQDRETLLADELVFVDSLLTSHLHRHTKSPTLWSHRRWLLAQRRRKSGPLSGDDVRGDVAAVVMVAAVRHPRNYYAWEHARWLAAHSSDDDDDSTKALLVADVRTWCFQHHTDTSGWSFLLHLLLANNQTARREQLLRDTLDQTEQRAASLRWTGEAVWVFLRTATAALGPADQNKETTRHFCETAKALQGRLDPASRSHQVLQQAQDWLSTASLHG